MPKERSVTTPNTSLTAYYTQNYHPHLKRSLNLAYLDNGTYDQIVAHLERELELSGLENDAELTIPTMIAVTPNDNQQNTEQTKVVCHFCEKPSHVIRECRKRMRKTNRSREMIVQIKI